MDSGDMDSGTSLSEAIVEAIYSIRDQRVMLDEDLARLYGVETKALNQAVRRNADRFPDDFMFQLSSDEWDALRSQSVTSNAGRGGRRYPPYAFTQEGVAMLSGVLNSPQAITVNVEIMRAFVRFRVFLSNHEELSGRLRDLELRFERKSNQQDQNVRMLVEAMRQLREEVRKSIPPPFSPPTKRRIGFHQDDDEDKKKPTKSKRNR